VRNRTYRVSIWFGSTLVLQGKAKVRKLVTDNAVICLSREIINNFLPTQTFCFIFSFLLPPFRPLLAANSDS
jgi:hypothetical protein